MMYLVRKPIGNVNSLCGWYGYLGIFISTDDYIKIPEQEKSNLVVLDKPFGIIDDWFIYDYEHFMFNFTSDNYYILQIPESLEIREGNELSKEDLEKVKYYEKLLGDTILVGNGESII